jgi:hypothetical protein
MVWFGATGKWCYTFDDNRGTVGKNFRDTCQTSLASYRIPITAFSPVPRVLQEDEIRFLTGLLHSSCNKVILPPKIV